jgi:DnaJ-class molecular chaperone
MSSCPCCHTIAASDGSVCPECGHFERKICGGCNGRGVLPWEVDGRMFKCPACKGHGWLPIGARFEKVVHNWLANDIVLGNKKNRGGE